MKYLRERHVRRSSMGALLAALCLALALATAGTSLASGLPGRPHPATLSRPPDGMSWRTYRLMMTQAPLDAAATKIQALAAKPGPAHRGFFETAVNDSHRILTVYWHGPVPAGVQRLIVRLRATVNIRVVNTRYSLATLNRDVLAAIRSGHEVTSGMPLTDGSGIEISVRSPNLRQVAAAMRSHLGVPVVATSGGVDQPQSCDVQNSNADLGPGSRCDDFAPWWGGDVIQQFAIPGYVAYCTGGFGVHDSAGHQYLLTAAHCAFNGHGYVNGITFYNGQDPSNYERIGQITDVPGTGDLAIIPASSGFRYYDGPGIYNGDTQNTKAVAGQQATSVGDSMCESGAFGGVLCGFTVRYLNVDEIDPYVNGQLWTSLALASSGSGNLTIDGDSGGPWFSLDGCCTHVWAKGIHHGLGRLNNTLYEVFTPITVATAGMGVTVNTG